MLHISSLRFIISSIRSKTLNPSRTVSHCAAVELGEGGIRAGGRGGKDALIGRRGFVSPVCAQQNLLASTIPGPRSPTAVCLGYIVAPSLICQIVGDLLQSMLQSEPLLHLDR